MNTLKRTGKRALAMLLCMLLAVSVSLLPSQTASAASWVTPYLEKLKSWDVVKGDPGGSMRPDSPITRAEFVAMMNRAYGYTDLGPIPFKDVHPKDWFYEDICKAYTAGIFKGHDNATAAPNAPLTREQAITLLARNMRLDEIPGEVIDFTDGRDFSPYSRGYVRAAILAGIIDGYADGTCRPQQNVTRGEAMKMLCVGIGSLINEPGVHAPGGVFGSLTINCTNVTLRDTIITGDLYISGGVSLGDVVLENVQVRGRIIIAGGGSSELGKNSILLRGVDTSTLIVDAPTGQYISVLTEGRTHITNGLFRSDAFLEDGCRDGYGILNVSLEGSSGDSFTLAGNLENVVNRTPNSTLILGDADASRVTIDEKATNSTLRLEVNAAADEVNLDVGTKVEGTGDIGHLTINSPDSTTTMLPDKITIRPGLDAEISGENMDASQAQEYSQEPRILNGYPKVANVAPTEADGIASTNKSGTVYWGLTTAAMGPVPDTTEGQDKLINPSYGSGFLLSGNYKSESSNTEFVFPEKLKGLTSSGTYYVSAVLVDARGHKSPVYSERFETPDNITPAFNPEYPRMLEVETEESWVTVMANKKCDLYYVLLPKGSTQPTQNEFLSFGFVDPLGYGRVGLGKNKTESVQVNRIIYPNSTQPDKVVELEEQATYDLYLWLADADGIKSSSITKLQFTTRDKTPPEFTTDMQQTTMGATNVGAECIINEPGTIYWVLVKTGENFPTPPKGHDPPWTNTTEEFLRDVSAKVQIRNAQTADGGKVIKRGSMKAEAGVPASTNITGLQKETIYDMYYIAVDNATPTGNYSDIVKKITVYTLDSTPPTAEVTFSRSATGVDNRPQPYADADVHIEFSENILYEPTSAEPLALYNTWKSKDSTISGAQQQAARQELLRILPEMIQMYQVTGGNATKVNINFENAKLELDRSGKMVLTLPSGTEDTDAINMGSGSTYYFEFRNIIDASPAQNRMEQDRTERFTTVSALANLSKDVTSGYINDNSTSYDDAIDMAFSLTPESTSSAEPGLRWNMKLWFDTAVEFDLYRRVRPEDKSSNAGWDKVGSASVTPPTNEMRGVSLTNIVTSASGTSSFPIEGTNDAADNFNLYDGRVYEYAIHFTKVAGLSNREDFTQYITAKVSILTGTNLSLDAALSQNTISGMEEIVNRTQDLNDITNGPGADLNKQFTDRSAPSFGSNLPRFTPGDSGVTMHLGLENRSGNVYYVIAPAENLRPRDEHGVMDGLNKKDSTGQETTDQTKWSTNVPEQGGTSSPNFNQESITWPIQSDIMNPVGNNLVTDTSRAAYGRVPGVTGMVQDIPVTGLKPNTLYYAYFVIEGTSSSTISHVEVYSFLTTDIVRPEITLTLGGSTVQVSSTHSGLVEYIVLPYTKEALDFLRIGDANKGAAPTGWKKQASGDDITACAALSMNATGGAKGSEYDDKADDTHKATLAQQIRSTSAGNGLVKGSGKLNVTANQIYSVDCSKMELVMDTDYIFLAVGKSDTGSADAFRATYPVRLTDTTSPAIVTVSPAVEYDETARRITGEIVVTFTENIYFKASSGTGTLADPEPICFHETNDPFGMKNHAYQCMSSAVNIKPTLNGSHGTDTATTNFSLTLNRAFSGEKVILGNTITDKAGNRIKPITITVKLDKDNNVIVLVDGKEV